MKITKNYTSFQRQHSELDSLLFSFFLLTQGFMDRYYVRQVDLLVLPETQSTK